MDPMDLAVRSFIADERAILEMNDPLGKAERACIVRHDEHGYLTTGTVNSSTVVAVL